MLIVLVFAPLFLLTVFLIYLAKNGYEWGPTPGFFSDDPEEEMMAQVMTMEMMDDENWDEPW